MHYFVSDFNGADEFFEGEGFDEWDDLASVLDELPLFMQPSGQANKGAAPIFDPKGTNAALSAEVAARGWGMVPVPEALTMFGNDWDGGKNTTLAEWQFSNYPFLWNNIIRTEAVINGGVLLEGVGTTRALVVVTKSGVFPSSNSTLYFEQAHAQIEAVMSFGTFSLPIRLVGLTVPDDCATTPAIWTTYAGNNEGRTSRTVDTQSEVTMYVSWSRTAKYGNRTASFSVA